VSSNRALANHKLYLAKIQLASWRQALAAESVAATTLSQAFLPAVRAHLLDAYGWFLLEVTGSEQATERPPQCCADLPDTAIGKALPGEIHEFRHLETEGWLGQLLAEPALQQSAVRSAGNLVADASELPAWEQAQSWIEQLALLFERMSDSLDEY
jgi:hypothetical protein